MQVLVHLAEAEHEVVTANDLLNSHWPSPAAEASNLQRVITRLWSKLGDTAATSSYIETNSKRGYRIADSCPIGWAHPQGNVAAEPTLAVLPCTNLGDSQDQDHFGDGLAKELVNILVKVEGSRYGPTHLRSGSGTRRSVSRKLPAPWT